MGSPLFFIASGYFFGFQESRGLIKLTFLRILNLLFIFVFSCAFYIFFYEFLETGNLLYATKKMVSGVYYAIATFEFREYPTHLWFLSAMAQGYLFLFLQIKFAKRSISVVILVALLAIGSLGQHHDFYSRIFSLPLPTQTRNALFFAFPYMSLGYMLNFLKTKMPFWGLLVLAITGWLGTIAEFFLSNNPGCPLSDYYLATPILCSSLFLLILQYSTFQNSLFSIMRPLSLYIYILHPAVIALMTKFFGELSNLSAFEQLTRVFYVCFLTTAISVALHFIIKNIKSAWVER